MSRPGVLLAIAAAAAAVAAGPLAPKAARGAPWDPRTSPCQLEASHVASPAVLLLGETVSITLRVAAACPPETSPLHLVLLVDASAGMAGDPNRNAKASAETIVRGMRLAEAPTTRVGIVAFAESARTLCGMTGDEERLLTCAHRVGAEGGSDLEAGLVEARRLFIGARDLAGPLATPNEVVLIVSDGAFDGGCSAAVAAAWRIKQSGVLIMTVGASRRADEACLRSVASSARYYFRWDRAARVVAIFDKVRGTVIPISRRPIGIVDTVPAGLDVVAGSARPPALVSADGRTLRWDTTLPSRGVTVTFRARPSWPGHQPASAGAHGDFLDLRGRPAHVTFPQPWLTVLDPRRLPGAGADAFPRSSTGGNTPDVSIVRLDG